MAYASSRKHGFQSYGEIIPTSLMIKNIPLDWKTDDCLHFIRQMKLPLPSAVNFLYDDFRVFRGMAFATFASSDESRRVIQALNNYHLHGWRLNVQFKRKRPDVIARDNVPQKTAIPFDRSSRIDAPEKPVPHLRKKICSASRAKREKTPPSESYNLLMSYQMDPVEKVKLKKFLEQTGDYREAVDEFAKNRAREAQEAESGKNIMSAPRLEMRPPTPGEELELAEWERRFGRGCGAHSNASLAVQRGEERDVVIGPRDGQPTGTDPTSFGAKRKMTFSIQMAGLGEGLDGQDTEKRGVEDDNGNLAGPHIGLGEKQQ